MCMYLLGHFFYVHVHTNPFQEHKQEIERLQDTIRRQEEELCNLRAERKLYVRPELENSLDRVERTIVNEINDECRRNSGILGNSPRKVNLKKWVG